MTWRAGARTPRHLSHSTLRDGSSDTANRGFIRTFRAPRWRVAAVAMCFRAPRWRVATAARHFHTPRREVGGPGAASAPPHCTFTLHVEKWEGQVPRLRRHTALLPERIIPSTVNIGVRESQDRSWERQGPRLRRRTVLSHSTSRNGSAKGCAPAAMARIAARIGDAECAVRSPGHT